MAKKALGKGLGALFDGEDNNNEQSVQEISILKIEPNLNQPRKNFDEEKIKNLSDSISEHGIIQPIVVKKLDNGFFQIIAGERRWRAARLAGIKKIPAIIKDFDDKKILEVALIENIQREELNPIEEAQAYNKLLNDFSLTQEEVSKRVGKSRSAIANSLRLLNLPEIIQELLVKDKLSMGHARALLAVDDLEEKKDIAKLIIDKNLSVRELEKLIRNRKDKKQKLKKLSDSKDRNVESEYRSIEDSLSNIFGTKVKIGNKKNKGKIEIEYYSLEELERIIDMLRK